MNNPNNRIGIRAVRKKDWDWWEVQLTGAHKIRVAHGYKAQAECGRDSMWLDGYPFFGTRANLIRRLHRMLGVEKLNWEVVE